MVVTCPDCDGAGQLRYPAAACPACGGTGELEYPDLPTLEPVEVDPEEEP